MYHCSYLVFRFSMKHKENNKADNVCVFNVSEVSTCIPRDHVTSTDVEQLQTTDYSVTVSTGISNNTASSSPRASENTDRTYNSSVLANADGNSVNVFVPQTSSTVGSSQSNVEQQVPSCSHIASSSEANDISCHNGSCRNSDVTSTSASDPAEPRELLPSKVKQSQVHLLPKPTFTLLPITVPLFLVVNVNTSQSSGNQARFPAIKPQPTVTVNNDASVPLSSQKDSTVVGCESLQSDLPRNQQKTASSFVTQLAALPAPVKGKTVAAATQTSGGFAPVSRLPRMSRASQVKHEP